MMVLLVALLASVAAPGLAGAPAAFQAARDSRCTEWHDCRQQALAAAERGDFETFHDLAWRAMQTGPAKDPELMYLLARAQALSGRPHDALVMLERLVEMGARTDAATSEDFARTRQLPGWPELAARLDRLDHPGSVPATTSPAPAVTAAAPAAPLPPVAPRPPAAPPASAAVAPAAAPVVRSAPATPAPEAVSFSTAAFSPGGVAYDAVSHRFLFGDRLGRKLIIVGEGANHAVDFVRADSAGFDDIAAIEIDARRGDLWVTSAPADNGGATLHKLQLVSGRPLKAFRVPTDLEPVKPVDLAVTPAGAVLVLDSSGGQLLVLRPGGAALERVIRIEAQEPASVAAGDDDAFAYVAHRDGLLRIDLRTRTAVAVSAPKTISLGHLERIRWYRRSLIAIRADEDGSRRIVRLDLSANGRAITQATTLQGAVPPAGRTFVTVSENDLVFLADSSSPDASRSASEAPAVGTVVAYRVTLR